MKLSRCLALLTLATVLSGCLGSVLPKAPHRSAYALAGPSAVSAQRALPTALLVEMPRTLAPLDGQDVIVVRTDGEIQLLPGVRWIAPAPALLQQLIARQLETSGSATSVSQTVQPYALPLRLSSDLRAFELREQKDGALVVHAALSVRLSCVGDSRILGSSSTIGVTGPPVPDKPTAAVAALRTAATDMAQQIVVWLDQVDASSCNPD